MVEARPPVLVLNLFGDAVLTAAVEWQETRWGVLGTGRGTGGGSEGYVALAASEDGLTGRVWIGGTVYRITPADDADVHEIRLTGGNGRTGSADPEDR